MENHVRNRNANENRVRTIEKLQYDFEKMMGSGILIQLTDLSGNEVCPEFVVSAEDMESIKQPIIASLLKSLELKRVLVLSELRELNDILAKFGQNNPEFSES